MLLLALVLQGSVPPPSAQLSADCAAPVYASDQLVCSDAELARMDDDMVRLLAATVAPSGPWIEPQVTWFRRSRMCAFGARHAACLIAAYRERIGLLTAAPGAVGPALSCRPSGYTATLRPDGFVLHDREGRLLGFAAAASAGWRPYLQLRVEPGRYHMLGPDGQSVAWCPHAWGRLGRVDNRLQP